MRIELSDLWDTDVKLDPLTVDHEIMDVIYHREDYVRAIKSIMDCHGFFPGSSISSDQADKLAEKLANELGFEESYDEDIYGFIFDLGYKQALKEVFKRIDDLNPELDDDATTN